MSPIADTFLRSWPFEPWLLLSLLLSSVIYVRGWIELNHRDPNRWHGRQVGFFLAGLTSLFVALASPVEPFASLLLQAHMVQHLLLMMVAPPLLWLGAPLFPMLRGIPAPIRTHWIAPLFRLKFLRKTLGTLTHPFCSLPIFIATTWLWHAPRFYETALRSNGLHSIQHICFLLSGLLFWYPVVRPYPGRPRWTSWLLFPYLILADISNTLLSALLAFSDKIIYPYYDQIPRIGGLSTLQDQAAAGVLMWVPGSIAYLVPLFGIGLQLLTANRSRVQAVEPASIVRPSTHPRPMYLNSQFDLLRVPLIASFLNWKHARAAMQLPLVALSVIVILDGLFGPRVAAMNLAGVLPWIHWRGLLMIGLLIAGNVFCMACPFMLPRKLAKHWLPAQLRWPRRFRNKWVAAILLAVFFWAYEGFSLWDSPWLTAWIAVAYFAISFVIEGFFEGAAFCKYLCPIGQFNFVQSMMSPFEVKVRRLETCSSCTTKDCIRGNETSLGCGMNLYLPTKIGNMDCTFCLDCIHACPHQNIGIMTTSPGHDLSGNAFHSGIGRIGNRPDLAVLILILVFGAFANAAGMVGPVVDWQERCNRALAIHSPLLMTTLSYLVSVILLPMLLVGTAALFSRRWGRPMIGLRATITRFSYALVPLGFSMWLAHYGFHLVASYSGAIPATQRFIADLGWPILGIPEWALSCCGPVVFWLPQLEVMCLDVGLLIALRTAYKTAVNLTSSHGRALGAFAPWAVVGFLLFATGVWIVQQPMQMRGTMPGMN